MPGMGMHQAFEQRFEQVIMQQQIMLHPGQLDAWRTEGEDERVSQQAVLTELLQLVKDGDYLDTDNFDIEATRAIFKQGLQAKLSKFGRGLVDLVRYYPTDEKLAHVLLTSIGQEGDDLPGRIVSSWNDTLVHPPFKDEAQRQRLIKLAEFLQSKKADVAAALDIISKAAACHASLIEPALVRLVGYANLDPREIPFAQATLAPLLRAAAKRKDPLTEQDGTSLFTKIVDQYYMLDRDRRIEGTTSLMADAVLEKGVSAVCATSFPVPLQVLLNNAAEDPSLRARVERLCEDREFVASREHKRRIYQGLAAIYDTADGERMLKHMASIAQDSSALARMLSMFALVHKDADFTFPLGVMQSDALVTNMRVQLENKSIARLQLPGDVLDNYVARLDSDQTFASISTIVTTLAGYRHIEPQIPLLRELITAELGDGFAKWRYAHDKAKAQMAVLGTDTDAWKTNVRSSRIVGELDGVRSHMDAVKGLLPKLLETYQERHGAPLTPGTQQELSARIAQNEEALRTGTLNKKRVGYETALMREQSAYALLLQGIQTLSVDNYQKVLECAEALSKKRSDHPLHDAALWVRETLDQPDYRSARRIVVAEVDDLETLLRFGETPVPHCQNWKNNSTLNESLLSFVADANKKLIHIRNGGDKPFSMSMLRLVDWEDEPTLLIENVYSSEWSPDYGIALVGALADKAMSICNETGKRVRVASNNSLVTAAFESFSKKYNVEVHDGCIDITPPQSKNTHEYWDCGPGLIESGSPVQVDVSYIMFSKKDAADGNH